MLVENPVVAARVAHSLEDRLPVIYQQAPGAPYPGLPIDEHLPLGAEVIEVLRELTGGDTLLLETVRSLLDVEQRHRLKVRRNGLFDELETVLRRGMYAGEDDAVEYARHRNKALGEQPPG